MKHSPRQLAEIAAALELEFDDISLLEQAFVHGSFVAEFPGVFEESNQRLEFLGDAVLGLIVAQELMTRFPEWPEGRMTQVRATLVDGQSLSEIGARLGLGNWLVMGRGEIERGGGERQVEPRRRVRGTDGCAVPGPGVRCVTRVRAPRHGSRTGACRRGRDGSAASQSRCCTRRRWSAATGRRCTRRSI